jgi:DHA1 family tetracycline resistance protein-like MFS transporter
MRSDTNDQETAEAPTQAAAAKNEKFFTKPLIIIFITVFIDLIGFGIVLPILPIYAESPEFNATPLEIGMLFAIYSWMQFFFSPILGRMSDKYGRRPILFFSILGSAVGYFLVGWAGSLALVFAGRIVSGVTGGNISTAQAYVADVTSKENRAKGMGLFGAAFGLGFILGPAIAGILSKYGIHVPFYFAAVLSLANAIALYFILPETVKRSERGIQRESENRFKEFFEAFRERQFGMINLVYFLLITAFSIMTYAFVLFTAHRFGYNAEQNGYLFAFVGLVSIVGQGFLFHTFADRFGESKLAAAGCFALVLALFAMPLVVPTPQSYWSFPLIGSISGGLLVLLGVCVLLSFGNAMASPALTSLASKVSHEEEQGKSLGILQSGASLARAIGPTIGGPLLTNSANAIDNSTIARTFWTASAIMLVAFVFAVYFARSFSGDSTAAGS